jgi:hypothetical protein
MNLFFLNLDRNCLWKWDENIRQMYTNLSPDSQCLPEQLRAELQTCEVPDGVALVLIQSSVFKPLRSIEGKELPCLHRGNQMSGSYCCWCNTVGSEQELIPACAPFPVHPDRGTFIEHEKLDIQWQNEDDQNMRWTLARIAPGSGIHYNTYDHEEVSFYWNGVSFGYLHHRHRPYWAGRPLQYP